MLIAYIQAAMGHAAYKILEDGTYFGEIPGLRGLWANASTLEACRGELQSSLEDWILLGLRLNHTLPLVDGLDLNTQPKQTIEEAVA